MNRKITAPGVTVVSVLILSFFICGIILLDENDTDLSGALGKADLSCADVFNEPQLVSLGLLPKFESTALIRETQSLFLERHEKSPPAGQNPLRQAGFLRPIFTQGGFR